MAGRTGALFNRVAARMRLAVYGVWFFRLLIIFAGVYGLLLLLSRVFDFQGQLFNWWTVPIVPVAAALAAFLAGRRVQAEEAAHLIDLRAGTKDLFLTASTMEGAPGEFRSLVTDRAEAEAARVEPSNVLVFSYERRMLRGAAVLAALVLATFFVPSLDLFGQGEQKQIAQRDREQLEKQKTQTDEKVLALEKQPLTEPTSAAVDVALKRLKQSLDRMKPKDPRRNEERLRQEQRGLESKWRKLSEKKLADTTGLRARQQFGAGDPRRDQELRRQMKSGDSSGMKARMQQIRDLAWQMKDSTDEQQRRELAKEIEQKLRELSDFAEGNISSSALGDSLMQAMEQVQLASSGELSNEALDALDQTMQLSELEADALAQSARDLQALEDALDALQLAQQLNDGNGLDGDPGAGSIGDYAALYEKLLAAQGSCEVCNGQGACKACDGKGGACSVCKGWGVCVTCGGAPGAGGIGAGMGGPGTGEGGLAPEDPDAVTNFKTSKARTALQAGRMLMQIKTQGTAPSGEAEISHVEALEQVKQGYSEAILQEQVPPGYHDAIRKYFDSLKVDKQPAATE
jgi:hypothetical protein